LRRSQLRLHMTVPMRIAYEQDTRHNDQGQQKPANFTLPQLENLPVFSIS